MVKFYRGLRSSYNPETHHDGIYFASDTHEILMNNTVYGAGSSTVARIDALDAVVNGPASTQGTVDNRIAAKIAELIAGADQSYDTLKEIADWITSDSTGGAALINDVSTLKKYRIVWFDGIVEIPGDADFFSETQSPQQIVFSPEDGMFYARSWQINEWVYYNDWPDAHLYYQPETATSGMYHIFIDSTDNNLYTYKYNISGGIGELIPVIDLTTVNSRLTAIENTLEWYEPEPQQSTEAVIAKLLAATLTQELAEQDLQANEYFILGANNQDAVDNWEIYKRTSAAASAQNAFERVCNYMDYNATKGYVSSFPTAVQIPVLT